MVDFISIIDASIEWTKAILFKPFSLKKWLILCFIALLAGSLSGGFNYNFGNGSTPKRKQLKTVQAQSLQQNPDSDLFPAQLRAIKNKIFKDHRITSLIAGVAILICCFLIFFIWLHARFSFIFLEALTKNDASIKIPFKSNKQIGNSFFYANLVICAVFLLAFGALGFFIIKDIMRLTAYNQGCVVSLKQILLIFLPYVFSIIALFILSGILSLIISDFVQIAMFKDRIKFVPAFSDVIGVINQNKGNFITYICIKMGLGIAAMIIFMLLYIICLLLLIIPAAVIVFLFYMLYQILPHLIFFIILFIIVAPIFLAVIIFFMCLYLPFAVFFRVLSMKFIARLKPEYNLFRQVNSETAS